MMASCVCVRVCAGQCCDTGCGSSGGRSGYVGGLLYGPVGIYESWAASELGQIEVKR
jgi:hypothetical protein